VLDSAGLIRGKTLGVDGTTLEANAAMKSIVRRDDGRSYTTPDWAALALAGLLVAAARRRRAR